MNDITPSALRLHIIESFRHLYPDATITVQLNDDETIIVELDDDIEGQNEVRRDDELELLPDDAAHFYPTFRCVIDSDDDQYLRFSIHDPDYEAENPEEDPLEYLCIRILAAPRESAA